MDELQKYLGWPIEDVEQTDSGLQQWWKSHAVDYPILSKLALSFIAVPASSAEVERLFSSAGQTIIPRRNKLSPATLEKMEALGSWLSAGLYKPPHAEEIMSHLRALGELESLADSVS